MGHDSQPEHLEASEARHTLTRAALQRHDLSLPERSMRVTSTYETLAGRHRFLHAVAKVNPLVLASLSQDVLPHLTESWYLVRRAQFRSTVQTEHDTRQLVDLRRKIVLETIGGSEVLQEQDEVLSRMRRLAESVS